MEEQIYGLSNYCILTKFIVGQLTAVQNKICKFLWCVKQRIFACMKFFKDLDKILLLSLNFMNFVFHTFICMKMNTSTCGRKHRKDEGNKWNINVSYNKNLCERQKLFYYIIKYFQLPFNFILFWKAPHLIQQIR